MAIGPDTLAIRFGKRQVPCTRTGGDHDRFGGDIGGLAILGLHADLALGGDRADAADDIDLVLLHQMRDAAVQLARHLAATIDHLGEVESRLARA